MAQNKSLLNYQRGYAGVVVDLEAMKPWERKCYLLGVWHVAGAYPCYTTYGTVVRAIKNMIKDETSARILAKSAQVKECP